MPWSKNGDDDGATQGRAGAPQAGHDPSDPAGHTPAGHNPWGPTPPPSGGGPRPQSPPGGDEPWRWLSDRLKGPGGAGKNGGGGSGSGGSGPGGSGWGRGGGGEPWPVPRILGVGLLAALALWVGSGVYYVGADEQGVVLRFGRWVRTQAPGLHFHLPTPIEQVLLPKVTRINRIEIGYRSTGDRRADRDVADESRMLTGDENLVDINFTVFWAIKDAGKYLFEIRDPEDTVKKAAESAMREIIGRTQIQPALTDARQQIEAGTRQLLQSMLDQYDAGIEVAQVQLQRVEPPAAVVEAFNDVQRARQDRERLRNEAESYRNDVLPRARGDAQRLLEEAEAYRARTVDGAQGDAQRFLSVLDAYNQAPDAAARRLYLDSMEETLRGVRKVVVDPKVPGMQSYLPLGELLRRPETAAPPPPATAPVAPHTTGR